MPVLERNGYYAVSGRDSGTSLALPCLEHSHNVFFPLIVLNFFFFGALTYSLLLLVRCYALTASFFFSHVHTIVSIYKAPTLYPV